MTITFENDNDIILYAFQKVISYARKNQQIFVAQCVWWLASIIGLEQGLVIHIDNLQKREFSAPLEDHPAIFHSDKAQQIQFEKAVSPTPRDLIEDQRADQVLERAERFLEESEQNRKNWNTSQRNQVNPLPQTKKQLRKANKIKCLQKAGKKQEAERNQRLQEIRAAVIQILGKKYDLQRWTLVAIKYQRILRISYLGNTPP
jgi:hypothetical protein